MRRFAVDFGRLYADFRTQKEALRGLERRLLECAETTREIACALSVEGGARTLLNAALRTLEVEDGALYLREGASHRRLASEGAGAALPSHVSNTPEALQALCEGPRPTGPGTDWERLPPGLAFEVPGRADVVGLLVLPAASELSEPSLAIGAILLGTGGVLIENLLVERRRERVERPEIAASWTQPMAPEAEGAFAGLGRSAVMTEVADLLRRVAAVDTVLLLLGETGTGKSHAAKLLHQNSSRSQGPFVSLNCAALPEALVESELFGHTAGAFTGARKARRGKVANAAGGTLFLDEIGDLPLATQAKLLTFLEERTYTPLGSDREETADVRIVSATHQDLEVLVAERRFREDLLYRINVFSVELPPLRQRGDDVIALAETFVAEIAQRYKFATPELPAPTRERLRSYAWPGNIRELRNVLEKAVILAAGRPLNVGYLPGLAEAVAPRARTSVADSVGAPSAPQRSDPAPAEESPTDPVADGAPSEQLAIPAEAVDLDTELSFAERKAAVTAQFESHYVRDLLERHGGNMSAAARDAKVDVKHLRKTAKKYEIDPGEFRG